MANFCLFQSSSQTESESPQLFLSRPFSWLRLRDASHCVTPIGGSSRRIVRWIHNLLTKRSSYIPNTLTKIDSRQPQSSATIWPQLFASQSPATLARSSTRARRSSRARSVDFGNPKQRLVSPCLRRAMMCDACERQIFRVVWRGGLGGGGGAVWQSRTGGRDGVGPSRFRLAAC